MSSDGKHHCVTGRARCRPGSRSRPPRRRRGSPASCPSRARRGRARRRARAGGGTTAATPRRRRLPGGIVERPRDAVARGSRRSPPGATPPFDSSPARLTCTSAGTSSRSRRRVRVERVDELAGAVDDLDLVRLQAADEVPAERVAVDGVLRLEVLRAVLADDLDPGLGERPPCRRAATYFVAATIVTSGPDLGARPARSARAAQPATAPITPWAPRPSAAAAVREEELRIAARAEVEPLDALARPPARSARSAAAQRSRIPSRVRSASKRAETSGPTS